VLIFEHSGFSPENRSAKRRLAIELVELHGARPDELARHGLTGDAHVHANFGMWHDGDEKRIRPNIDFFIRLHCFSPAYRQSLNASSAILEIGMRMYFA
jgi:hypothetical protein